MSRLPRFGSALSALALASVIGGCAGPMSRQAAHASKIDKSDIGLATRAHAALTSGDYANAVALAERAVENSPNDGVLRALLANSYFAAGRFASAETTYRDALAVGPDKPEIVLKLALVQIALGKPDAALAFLNESRRALEPSNFGLALALAGQPAEAVAVLDRAARLPGADAQVRQNLALAHGLAGDWLAARTIAAQDLSPAQLDSRIQQWMAFAQPERASDQVAALTGVTPAAADPGQPVQLALKDSGTRYAALGQPRPFTAPTPEQSFETAPVPEMNPYAPPQAETVDAPVQPEYQPTQMAALYQAPAAEAVASGPVVVPAAAEPAPPPPLVKALAPTAEAARPLRTAKSSGKAGVVVQLGAFSSLERVESAWEQFADRFGSLRDYTPTSARFDSSKGTVYRLSVKGFGSFGEASDLCSALKSKGKSCFVRRIAGDSPVQFAAR